MSTSTRPGTVPRPVAAAVATVLLGATVFAVLAVWAVPWDPVPGSTPPAADATSVFTADEIARAEGYASLSRVLGRASTVVSVVVALLLGFTRLGRRLVARAVGPWWVRVPVAVALVLAVGRLATLPLAVAQRRHALAFGLTEQSWSAYAVDLLVGLAVQVVAVSVALLVLLGVRRVLPRVWPAVAGLLLAALVMAASFAYPVLVEPLRNTVTPLPEGQLRTEILEVAAAEDVALDDVLVTDASRRTTTLNAYVSGYGGTRRVVLFDTLVDSLPRREVVSVVAHELAHARHDDVLVGSGLGAAAAATGGGALGLLVGSSPRPRRRGSRGRDDSRGRGSRTSADPAGDEAPLVPRVLALLAVVTLVATPVQSTISRAFETRADVEALCVTGDPAAFESLQRELGRRSLSDPTPAAWSQAVFGSHPTTLQRIGLARGLDGC